MVPTHTRSPQWIALQDAAIAWQQIYDALMYEEGRAYSTADQERVASLQQQEQRAYDYWQACLVTFMRSQDRS